LDHCLQPFFGKGKVGPDLLRIIRLHPGQIEQIGECLKDVAGFPLDEWADDGCGTSGNCCLERLKRSDLRPRLDILERLAFC
jgi:hypothetical protein